MRVSAERMGEQGLRGLAGLGATVPPGSQFWIVQGMPEAFTPAQAVNLGPKPPATGLFLKGYAGYSALGDGWIMTEFAASAFTDGLNGVSNPRGKPTTFANGTPLTAKIGRAHV